MNTHRLPAFLFLLVPLLLSHCQQVKPIMDFRKVQDKFDAATRTENLTPGAALSAPSAYKEVIASLPEDPVIKGLESKLKPTAWMMRAISEWRTGDLSAAADSAERGSAARPPSHSRDAVLLTLVPALVIDSGAVDQWRTAGKTYTADQYKAGPERSYRDVVKHLNDTEDACGPGTNDETRHYLAYQKWRMLRNWQLIIEYLDDSAVDQALADTKPLLGGRIPYDVADSARQTVPAGHPLRALMDVSSGQLATRP